MLDVAVVAVVAVVGCWMVTVLPGRCQDDEGTKNLTNWQIGEQWWAPCLRITGSFCRWNGMIIWSYRYGYDPAMILTCYDPTMQVECRNCMWCIMINYRIIKSLVARPNPITKASKLCCSATRMLGPQVDVAAFGWFRHSCVSIIYIYTFCKTNIYIYIIYMHLHIYICIYIYKYTYNMVGTRSAWSRVPGFFETCKYDCNKKMHMDQHGLEVHFDWLPRRQGDSFSRFLPRLNSLGHKIPVFFQIITLSCLRLDPVHPWYGFHHVSIYSSC